MAVIAVTGASGFIGRHFVEHLSRSGHRAVALSRADLARPQATLRGVDVVVHAAGRAHVLKETAADPAAAFHEVNVELTDRMLSAAKAAGARRFVLLSSAGVLGNVTDERGVDDDSPPCPYDHYSRSKLAAERLLAGPAGADIETVIVRPPVVYGPGARGNFERILRGVQSGAPLPIGALRMPRSLIGLRNLGDFLVHAAVHPRAPGPAMVVSDAAPLSVRDLALAIGAALHKSPRLVPIPVWMLKLMLSALGKGADIPRLTSPWVVRPTRAIVELGWRPPHSTADELTWAVNAGSAT